MQSFNTSLLLAAKHAEFDVLNALLEHKANVDAQNTKVMLAVYVVCDNSKAKNWRGSRIV